MRKIFGILLLLILVSCSNNQSMNQGYSPVILDQENILNEAVIKDFNEYEYPNNVFPILCAQSEISNKLEVGHVADTLFNKFAKDHVNFPGFENHGLLVVISQNPHLIQVRVGNHYSAYCKYSGATRGEEYLALQKKMSTNKQVMLTEFLDLVSNSIDDWNHKAKRKKNLFRISTSITEHLFDYEDTQSKNIYSKSILKPLLSALTFLVNIFDGWWPALIFFFCVTSLITHIIGNALIKTFKNDIWSAIAGIIITLAFSYAVIPTAFILSSGRMEDIITLQALGISQVGSVIGDISWFGPCASFGISFLLVVTWILWKTLNHDLFMSLLPNEFQKQYYILDNHIDNPDEVNENPYTKEYAEKQKSSFNETIIPIAPLLIASLILPKITIVTFIAICLSRVLGNLILFIEYLEVADRTYRKEMLKKMIVQLSPYIIVCIAGCATIHLIFA